MRVPLLLILFCILLAQSAFASDFKSQKKDAYDGNSKVYDAFIESYNSQTERVINDDQSDLPELFLNKRQSAMDRDIHSVIAERFSEYSPNEITRFADMSETDLLALIGDKVSESDLLNMVLARSKKLSTAESNWNASLNLYPQTAYLQDLLLRFNAFSEGMSLGIGRDYNREMVQMMHPVPGMLSMRGEIVDLDLEIAWQEYIREVINVLSDTKSTLADIKTKQELLKINKSSESLLRVLRDVIDAQYRSGTRSFSDLIRIKTEWEKRKDTVFRIESMLSGLYSQLASQMDFQSDIEFGAIAWTDSSRLEFDYDEINQALRSTNPDLNIISQKLKKMELMIEMSKLKSSPDLTVGFTYYQGREVEKLVPDKASDMEKMSDMDTQDMDMTQMNFMNKPMVDYKNYEFANDISWLAELIERKTAMTEMLDAKTNMISGMLSMLNEKLMSMNESESVYRRRIIPDAEAALDVVRKGYSSDENSFNDLISSEMSLIMAKMELANIQNEKSHSIIEIERLTGYSLISQSPGIDREVN